MMDTHTHLIVKTVNRSEQSFSHYLQYTLNSEESLENISKPILNFSQYLNTYKYIYRNPVEAHICQRAEDYKYSSLNALIGRSQPKLRVYDQIGLIQNPFQVLNWLNSDSLYKYSKFSCLEKHN